MASQALYRRYRSQTFGELVGQEHIVQTLRNALAEGRIAHAYLFTGPRGVGKTTVARLLAKAVNCLAPEDQRPCGACEMCEAIAEGRAVDVIEMDAASHTSVEDAREIIERVQFRPSLARTKVYIVDECHMLSTAAFNALLKTLEEPPSHALFVLATTEVHKVPATILSRCQRFVFSRHTIASTAAHLREIAAQEGFELEAGAPEAIARAATGSMRDALSVLDQLMAYGGGRVTLAQVRGLLGATESQEVTALLDALLAANVTTALTVVAQVAGQGADLRQFARDVVERLRALMLLKAGASASLLDAGEDELATLRRQTDAADLGALVGWVRLFGELDYQLRTSPYGQLPLELAVVEALTGGTRESTQQRAPAPAARQPLGQRPVAEQRATPAPAARPPAAPPATPAPAQPVSAPQTAPERPADTDSQPTPAPQVEDPFLAHLSQAPAPSDAPSAMAQPAREEQLPDEGSAAATPPAAPAGGEAPDVDSGETIEAANADAIAFEHVESVWPSVVRDVRPFDKTLQALLNSGVRPVDVKEQTVILEAPSEWLQRRLETPQLRQVVEKVLSKHMGANYAIRCVVEAQTRENPNVLREQIRTVRKDELVKAALNIFDADIIGVDEEKEPPL
jgi:DNA polymerase III subunit gamma/tau